MSNLNRNEVFNLRSLLGRLKGNTQRDAEDLRTKVEADEDLDEEQKKKVLEAIEKFEEIVGTGAEELLTGLLQIVEKEGK